MRQLKALAKRILPERSIEWYRRRRALRSWLREVAGELYDRQSKLQVEDLEGRILARRPDITDRLMKDLLMRTDLILQELDRKIEALRARHGTELHELRDQVASLRSTVEAFRGELEAEALEPPGSGQAVARAE